MKVFAKYNPKATFRLYQIEKHVEDITVDWSSVFLCFMLVLYFFENCVKYLPVFLILSIGYLDYNICLTV